MPLPIARIMPLAAAFAMLAIASAGAGELRSPPGTMQSSLNNNVPLAFGMSKVDAATALGAPLAYISGRPGDEILLAIRDVGGSGYFARADRLFLKFRRDRLTGWKGDWGNHWPWQ